MGRSVRIAGTAFTLVTAVMGLAFSPVNVAAEAPVIQQYTVTPSATLSGICSFDIRWSAVIPVTETDYFDSTGQNIRIDLHTTETDTFVGPGAALISDPYTGNTELEFQGNTIVSAFGTGEVLKVRLPNGLYMSAGRTNFALVSGVFVVAPTFGHAGNLDAFCAALRG